MPGKTSLFILLIFSILYLQCTPKIYDTPEVNAVYTTINVSFTVPSAMSVGSKVLFTPVVSGGAGTTFLLTDNPTDAADTLRYIRYTLKKCTGIREREME